MLIEVLTFDINGSYCSAEKKFSISFSKTDTNFYLSLHQNAHNIYLLVNGKEIFKFKAGNKNINLPTQFCLGSISNEFRAAVSREVSLSGNVYNFFDSYNSIDKSDRHIKHSQVFDNEE